MTGKAVIIGLARSPFGRFGGSLRDIDAYELSALVMKEAVRRSGIDGSLVDEVYWGVGDTSSCKDVYTPVVARQALLKAGLPPETPSCSFDKACVSGISAIQMGLRAIKSAEAEVILAGGVTTFSSIPLVLRDVRWQGYRLGPPDLEDPLVALGYKDYNPVAVDAGEVALEQGITREEQDQWALRSHERYGEAYRQGKYEPELMPVEIPNRGKKSEEALVLDIDEQYRPDINLEKLQKLKTIYGSPTVTPGNAPGLNDGSAALVMTTETRAEKLGLRPRAEIVTIVSTAMEPRMLAAAPAKAIKAALDQSALSLDDMHLLEINEAFAAVTLTSSKLIADGDAKRWHKLKERLNINGGAIAVGHANTCSGTRLVMTMITELERRGGGYGIAAICGGLAQADACIIKVE